uniref:Cytochrome P450 302A1 n=1 Tax=Pardosa pseudoannulata TaxID=330961 RepID=A0A6H0C3J6_9ARAC|nr:cytochrome P450 302A1 [Pardosa pseudoannulata]
MKRVKSALRVITTAIEKVTEVENVDVGPKPFKSMPGPKPLPLIKNLWRYFPIIGSFDFKRIHRTYARMYEEYGPIVREEVFGDRIIVHVYDPVDMSTVYKNEGRLPCRQSHRVLAKYRMERPEKYSCPGLFPSNGEEWYTFRHKFQKTLMAATTGEVCSSSIENITEDLISIISTKLDDKLELDIQPLLFRWALECIGVVTLNRRLGCLTENGNKEVLDLVKAVHNTHEAVFATENSPLKYKENYRMLTESQDYLSTVVEKYFEEATGEIRNGKHEDSVLARMMDTDASKKDLFTMILDMFLAGIDTTAYALAFALYNLARNREVQDKLREELRTALPEKHSRLSEKRCRMPYLQLVIKETLRVNPIAIGTGRILPCDTVLGGYKVPAKTMIILQHQVASKLDKYFEDPDRFYPERWTQPVPLVSSPFGYGPRLCIGSRIARKEMQLAIARIVRNFLLSYHHEEIDSFNKLINVPDKPVLLRFESLPR